MVRNASYAHRVHAVKSQYSEAGYVTTHDQSLFQKCELLLTSLIQVNSVLIAYLNKAMQ